MTVRTHDHNVPPKSKVKSSSKLSQKICRQKFEDLCENACILCVAAYILGMENNAIAVARATIQSIREPRQTALAAYLG